MRALFCPFSLPLAACPSRLRINPAQRKSLFIAVTAIAVLTLASGCVDTAAVTSFSTLAPNASQLDRLTAAYAAVSDQLPAVDVVNHPTAVSPAQFSAQFKERQEQIIETDALHSVLVNYMKELGALADNKLIQTSTDAKAVTDGLAALQKAKPSLGLTSAIISGVGDICTFLADAATTGYRKRQLATIIGKYGIPFQKTIEAERKIVTQIIRELQNLQERTQHLAEVTHALKVDDQAVVAATKPPGPHSKGEKGLDQKLQQSGAADIAALYLLQKSMNADLLVLHNEIRAAQSYEIALAKIEAAYRVLYMRRNNILTKAGAKAAITQLLPLVKDGRAALQALNSI